MNGKLLAWFSMMPWASAIDSLIVPKPLESAISVAKPTRYWESRSVFQSEAEKSFFVSMQSRRSARKRDSFFLQSAARIGVRP
jgi:hypothetical protein